MHAKITNALIRSLSNLKDGVEPGRDPGGRAPGADWLSSRQPETPASLRL